MGGNGIIGEVAIAYTHGFVNGMISAASGGDFTQGFLSGGLSSFAGSAFMMYGAKFAGSVIGTYAFSAIAGGIGSALSGGNFWEGAATGIMVAGLNHLQNSIYERIAQVAESYEGSSDWAVEKQRGRFKSGSNKCNQFVYEILDEAGVAPYTNNKEYPLAGEWANTKRTIKGKNGVWRVVKNGIAKRGDVVSRQISYGDATGHVAIGVSNTQSIGTYQGYIRKTEFGYNPNFGVRNGLKYGSIVVRRFYFR